MQLLDMECRTDLMLKTANRPAFDQGALKGFELSADALDQFARTAEIDGMLPAVEAVAQPIVRAEPSAIAVSPTGGDVALPGEEFRSLGKQTQGWVIELVSRHRDFQFWRI